MHTFQPSVPVWTEGNLLEDETDQMEEPDEDRVLTYEDFEGDEDDPPGAQWARYRRYLGDDGSMSTYERNLNLR